MGATFNAWPMALWSAPGKMRGGFRMGRGRRGLFDDLALLPWPVGLAVGAFGFLAIRHGIPTWLSRQDGLLAQGLAQSNPFSILAWMFMAMCAIAAFASFVGARRKRRLLDTRTGLDSVAALGWRDFERLVGEAFRRQGHAVEETGLGGAGGGIDLILRRGGRRILVQCKQWRREKVPVNVVREMYGLLAHHQADEVRIAALGGFTRDAARFAEGKPIELIDGSILLGMIRDVQSTSEAPKERNERSEALPAELAPKCPRCDAPMMQRMNRQTGAAFWGCSTFPRCRATR